MDGLTLLREVSEAYRSLQTLALEASFIDESGDEDSSNRSERRVRFFYAAPNRFRYEPASRRGIFAISDGETVHRIFGGPQGKRHTSHPLAQSPRLPHRFNAQWPTQSEAFLFDGIEEGALSADIAREEDGCYIVGVEYRRDPSREGMLIQKMPVLFWIDGGTRMVMRTEGETGHRRPTEEEIFWSRRKMIVRSIRVNEPLREEMFDFTLPPDVEELETGGQCGGFGIGRGGGGFSQRSGDPKHSLEFQGSHEWQGDTLVERSRWKIRDLLFTIERRFTFSEDGSELRIADRIAGPKGEAETKCKLPVA